MEKYSERTAQYLNTFLGKEGYVLLKTEFVKEDGNYYLRAYIDLTEEEKSRRMAERVIREETEELPDGMTAETSEEEAEENAPEEAAEPGIGINDCANVSRRLSKWLDKEDFIDEVYTLEVCSKGYLESERND